MSELPEFRHVTVHRPVPGACLIRWAVQPHAWPMADLAFLLYRSNAIAGPWEHVATVTGAYQYTDPGVYSAGVGHTYYYIVRVASTSGKGFRDSAPTKLGYDMDAVATELVRKKVTYLATRVGRSVAILPARRWGPNCNRCYNHQKQNAEDPDCPECYGTGYAGGFLNPVYTLALLNPSKKAIVAAGITYEEDETYAELANLPEVRPEDVLVDARLNVRYHISSVNPTTRVGALIAQIVTLVRLDEFSQVYQIPIEAPESSAIATSWLAADYGRATLYQNRAQVPTA